MTNQCRYNRLEESYRITGTVVVPIINEADIMLYLKKHVVWKKEKKRQQVVW